MSWRFLSRKALVRSRRLSRLPLGDRDSAASFRWHRRFRARTITSCVGNGRYRRSPATSITGPSLGQRERSSHRCRHTRCPNSSNATTPTLARYALAMPGKALVSFRAYARLLLGGSGRAVLRAATCRFVANHERRRSRARRTKRESLRRPAAGPGRLGMTRNEARPPVPVLARAGGDSVSSQRLQRLDHPRWLRVWVHERQSQHAAAMPLGRHAQDHALLRQCV